MYESETNTFGDVSKSEIRIMDLYQLIWHNACVPGLLLLTNMCRHCY